MRRSLLSVFIPNPYAFLRNVNYSPPPKTPEHKTDGYSVFLAQQFATNDDEEIITCAECGQEKRKYYCHICLKWFCSDNCYGKSHPHFDPGFTPEG